MTFQKAVSMFYQAHKAWCAQEGVEPMDFQGAIQYCVWSNKLDVIEWAEQQA